MKRYAGHIANRLTVLRGQPAAIQRLADNVFVNADQVR